MGRNKTDSKVKQVTHQNKTRKQTDHDTYSNKLKRSAQETKATSCS